jgi:hypothetical protein
MQIFKSYKFLLLLVLIPLKGVMAQQLGTEPQEVLPAALTEGLQSIKSEELKNKLKIIASDSFEGRGTGSIGQKKAAQYIAEQFKELGVQPGNKSLSSYYQPIELIEKTTQSAKLFVNKKEKIFLKDFYVYGDMQLHTEANFKTIGLGYGIDHENYSDYQNVDIKGKGVVIFMGEPTQNGKSLVTNTAQYSNWAFDWKIKAQTALDKGAKAVFIVVGNKDEDFTNRLNSIKDHLKHPVIGFQHKQKASAFFVSYTLAAELLKTSKETLIQYKEQLGSGKNTVKLGSSKVNTQIEVSEKILKTENVIGFIEGSLYPEEVIVITAHYDHLGIENGKIYYGADDDGSGTAALIEIAEAFMYNVSNNHRPARSIVIMAVTAEEKGLVGSEYYTDFPLFPLKNTVANLNIDMIGRVDTLHKNNPNYVYIIGSDRLSSELHQINELSNLSTVNITLDYKYNKLDDPNRFYYRSDHYNFAKNNIPVIFYFSGVHEDYHKTTDTVDKIDFIKMNKIVQLVYGTAWYLANIDHKIKVDNTEE